MNLLSGFFREGPLATPSMTRLVLALCAFTACVPLLAWTVVFLRYAWAPDLPGGVIAGQGALLGLAAGLKGWERQAVEQTNQVRAGTTTTETTKLEVKT